MAMYHKATVQMQTYILNAPVGRQLTNTIVFQWGHVLWTESFGLVDCFQSKDAFSLY